MLYNAPDIFYEEQVLTIRWLTKSITALVPDEVATALQSYGMMRFLVGRNSLYLGTWCFYTEVVYRL